MRGYFERRVKVRNAHTERWREEVPERRQDEVDARYGEILDRLEADGVHCAPLLRQRPRAAGRSHDRPRPRRRAARDPELLFIGGTGRSGTHVLSQLLGNHSRYARVPIEARFHVNPQGFPDLLAGQVTPDQFLKKLRRFWWKRIRAGEVAPGARSPARLRPQGPRACTRSSPSERFDAAVAEFEATAPADLDARLPQPLPRPALAARRRGGQARA